MREPTKKELKQFTDAANALAELGSKGFFLYLAMDSLNLMTGPSHDDDGTQRQDRVCASVSIPGAGGGDW